MNSKKTRKKYSEKTHESSDRWLVSYADFVTLLFAFFVVLFATSQKDFKKSKEFEESVKKYLTKYGMSQSGISGTKISDTKNSNAPIQSPLKKHGTDKKSADYQLKVETYIEKNMSQAEIEKIIKDISLADAGIRISLNANEIFVHDSEKMKRGSLVNLDKVANALKGAGYRIFVESYTDSNPITNKLYQSHWELAANRSTSVIRYLIKVHGYDPGRIAAISYGSQKPLVPQGSKSLNSENERLDFLVATDDLPL